MESSDYFSGSHNVEGFVQLRHIVNRGGCHMWGRK